MNELNHSRLTKVVTANKRKDPCGGLESLDIYGEPVHLYYKGKPTYTTKVGAILTLLTYIWLLFIAGLGCKRMYHDWNPVLSEYTSGVNMTNSRLNPFEKGKGFDISFGGSGNENG